MVKIRVIGTFFVLLILLGVYGCTDSTEEQVQQTVRAYNDTLLQVFSTGNIDLLTKVATEHEVRRVTLFLTFLNDAHKVMNAKLKQLDIVDTRKQTKTTKDGKKTSVYYQVYSNEQWEYTYLDSRTSKVVEGPSTINYKVVYDVVQLTGHKEWLVYKVNFQSK